MKHINVSGCCGAAAWQQQDGAAAASAPHFGPGEEFSFWLLAFWSRYHGDEEVYCTLVSTHTHTRVEWEGARDEMEKRGRFPPSLHEYIVSWSHWEDRKRHRVIRWNKRSYMCRTCLRNIKFLSSPQYHSDPVTVVCTSTGSPLTGSANSWFCSVFNGVF